jgi:hypothetical protein
MNINANAIALWPEVLNINCVCVVYEAGLTPVSRKTADNNM